MGSRERRYRVGTFPDRGDRLPRAYLRWYSPAWDFCIEYEVMATSGKEAKRIAIELRNRAEAERKGGGK